MSDIVDHGNQRLLTNEFEHRVLDANGTTLDVISSNGNLWLSGPQVMEAMGMIANGKGDYSRRLRRISHPDIIRVSQTPFRFADGRRNNGSLISPRAVLKFAEGGTQGFNPFKALPFVEWMQDVLLEKQTAEAWSPACKQSATLEPVCHKIKKGNDQDQAGLPLDPLRPVGLYLPMVQKAPVAIDEVEFCLCPDSRAGLGKCWCRKGKSARIRGAALEMYDGCEIIDEEDDFSPFSAWSRRAA